MPALHELLQLVEGQTTVRTSKLKPIVEQLVEEITQHTMSEQSVSVGTLETAATTITKLEAEVERKENVIVRLQEEAKQHTLVRERHKTAMQDYENLKRNHKRLKEEYNILVASKSKDKKKVQTINRELTDCQVKLASYEKKLKKAGLL